jgi:hypothetical protein
VIWIEVLLAFWLVIFLHELGHCLMALAQGYRFLFIIVGPLRLEAAPGGLLRLVRNRSWAMAGGVCAAVPDALPVERLSSAQQRVLLAGPGTSLLVGLTMLLIGITCDIRFAVAAGAASLGISVATLIPLRQGMLLSDGLAYWTLRRGGPGSERHLARIAIATAFLSPDPPSSWSRLALTLLERDLRERTALPGQPEWQSQLNDRLMLYCHYADGGEPAQAGATLAELPGTTQPLPAALLRLPVVVNHELIRAFHLAWFEHDAIAARTVLDSMPRAKAIAPADWQRAQAAVQVAEGNLAGARATLQEKVAPIGFAVVATGAAGLSERWRNAIATACQES